MKKAVFTILLLMVVSNAYAYPIQSVSIADDIIDSVKDGITSIINAVINVINKLLGAVADAITYPFKLLANNFSYSSDWWNSRAGGFSPVAFAGIIVMTVACVVLLISEFKNILMW